LDVDDFNKHLDIADLQKKPPKVIISLIIAQSENEDFTSDDLVTVSNWLTKLETPYTAQLTYEFFLPESELDEYQGKLALLTTLKDCWTVIKHEFLRKYISKLYGGNPDLKVPADTESLHKFDYQFMNAIRDVERDMFTGRNTLLREVVDFFIDYDIKSSTKTLQEKHEELKKQKKEFSINADALLTLLKNRMAMGETHILQYAQDTGASFNDAEPGFDGAISEVELYSALRLILKYTAGIEIPATHNGLGYNNLIYMSLLLAKMQVDTDGNYLGSNAKVFPVLVIEEPEAHLHPAMQYKFLKFLRNNIQNKARQIFITSHSTHITSAVLLDEIICLNQPTTKVNVGYPAKTFDDTPQGKSEKAFVQRFLDATRSDMLFAKNIILVEGLAEQLLMATFAKYVNQSIEDNHVAVINIGGRYFEHFLKMFDVANTPYALQKFVACITDRDPARKDKIGNKEKYRACYPYEHGKDTSKYDYKNHAAGFLLTYAAHPNIRFFSQCDIKGKTLEYELSFRNPTSTLLLTGSVSNSDELNKIIAAIIKKDSIATIKAAAILRDTDENKRILDGLDGLNATQWPDSDLLAALMASRYLNSIGKGENALELADALEKNLLATPPEVFNIPTYIKDAIDWACQK
jgi:predicted ATP-dependent endonuclease of OLD family